MAQGDALYNDKDIEATFKSITFYEQAVKQEPQSYAAHWKAARSHRMFAQLAREQNRAGWKKLCEQHGRKALTFGKRAMELNPKGIEGNFWYGCAAGTYADGVSIVTAFTEGLADKTREGFENAYRVDRKYLGGAPMKALGRYWSVLPWPLKDREKAVTYLLEFVAIYPHDPEGQVYLAEVLLERNDGDDQKQAHSWLRKTLQDKSPFYRAWAQRLIKEYKLEN
jgi:hypothetical protein